MRQTPFQCLYSLLLLLCIWIFCIIGTVSMKTSLFFCVQTEKCACVCMTEREREEGFIRCFRIFVIVYLTVWVYKTFSFHSPKLGQTIGCNKYFWRYFDAIQRIHNTLFFARYKCMLKPNQDKCKDLGHNELWVISFF